jgi:hypothetical protein
MSILSSLTSSALNQLSTLVDKKEELVKEIERLESQMASIISGKPIRGTKGKPGRPAAKGPKAKTARKTTKRGSRGNLGTKVLSALEAAGDAGVKVADLAEKLRVKGTNLHVWFGTTGKKNKAIKKVGKGHYRLQRQK